MGCAKRTIKNRKIKGYSRCRAGTAGKRGTRAERARKVCVRGGKKVGVTKHTREVRKCK